MKVGQVGRGEGTNVAHGLRTRDSSVGSLRSAPLPNQGWIMSHHYIHFGTIVARGSGVASGSLRPFGPVSGSNVAHGSSVLYLTRGG